MLSCTSELSFQTVPHSLFYLLYNLLRCKAKCKKELFSYKETKVETKLHFSKKLSLTDTTVRFVLINSGTVGRELSGSTVQ